MADNPFIDDPEGFLRGLLTPKTIVDSLIEATEPLVGALQLDAKASLQIGLMLGMAIPEVINKTLKAIEEAEK